MEVCASCSATENLKRCGRCKKVKYCSTQCQRNDIFFHLPFCIPATTTNRNPAPTTFRPNPWYTPVSPTTPEVIATKWDEAIVALAKSGDCEGLSAFIKGESLAGVNTIRGFREGETLLHFAVMSGNPLAIRLLIEEGGAFVNAVDWRDNTPLYYAATHPGEGECLANDEDKRCAVIQVLLEHGADTMRQGGFSGKRPFEQAQRLGYAKASKLIEDSPTKPLFCRIRNSINMLTPPEDIAQLVEEFLNLSWTSDSITWFIRPNRMNMSQCFKPMPEIVEKFDGSLQSVESLFRELQQNFARWWTSVEALSKQQQGN